MLPVWFTNLRNKAAEWHVPAMDPVDNTDAEAALEHAMETHRAAQEQRVQATQAVSELRQVNIRNGFAPAIEASIVRKLGGAT